MKLVQWALAIAVLGTSACGTPTRRIDPDQDDDVGGTGIDSGDVRNTADQICRALLSNRTLFEKGTPVIVIESPDNRTRFQIDSSIFVTSMRAKLMESAEGRILFLAREDMKEVMAERERKRSGAVSTPTDATGKPDLAAAPLGTQYFLKGTLQSVSKQNGEAVSDYILATFRVTDAETTALIFERGYDWKKIGSTGVIYR